MARVNCPLAAFVSLVTYLRCTALASLLIFLFPILTSHNTLTWNLCPCWEIFWVTSPFSRLGVFTCIWIVQNSTTVPYNHFSNSTSAVTVSTLSATGSHVSLGHVPWGLWRLLLTSPTSLTVQWSGCHFFKTQISPSLFPWCAGQSPKPIQGLVAALFVGAQWARSTSKPLSGPLPMASAPLSLWASCCSLKPSRPARGSSHRWPGRDTLKPSSRSHSLRCVQRL